MKKIKQFLAFSLVTSLLFTLLFAETRTEENEAVICYSKHQAFSSKRPNEWTNNPDVARDFGICAFYTPKGTNFDTANAFIYPQLADSPENMSPREVIDNKVNITLNDARAHSIQAKDITAKKLETYTTKSGLIFEIWLYDNGAMPNKNEAVAYYVGDKDLFFLVLTAHNQELRDNAIPELKEVAESVFIMQVANKQ